MLDFVPARAAKYLCDFEPVKKSGGNPMAEVKELTVSLENRQGTLAAVTESSADAKVNVLAVLGGTAGAQGSAQVVDKMSAAKKQRIRMSNQKSERPKEGRNKYKKAMVPNITLGW